MGVWDSIKSGGLARAGPRQGLAGPGVYAGLAGVGAVVQRRLDASGVRARVVVAGNRLRVEFADEVDRPVVSQLVTGVGAIVFWDSPGPVSAGTAMHPDAPVILTDAEVAPARATPHCNWPAPTTTHTRPWPRRSARM